MKKRTKWMRRMRCAVVLTVVLATILSAGIYLIDDAVEGVASSIIRLTDGSINTNRDKYFNSSVVYKLPDTVKDTDKISVIIQMKTDSLLMPMRPPIARFPLPSTFTRRRLTV